MAIGAFSEGVKKILKILEKIFIESNKKMAKNNFKRQLFYKQEQKLLNLPAIFETLSEWASMNPSEIFVFLT